jgi:uncharacterized delta-60 repeat protein
MKRYSNTGVPDSTFATNGALYLPTYAGIPFGIMFYNIAILPNDQILVTGDRNGASHFFALKLTIDGQLDSSFGINGITPDNFNHTGYTRNKAMTIQPDGKIIVGGEVYHNIGMVRYLPNGMPDSSFGTDGKVLDAVNLGRETGTINGIGILPDGRIFCGGYAPNNVGDECFSAFMFQPNGRYDSSFGTYGKVKTWVPGAMFAYIQAAIMQHDYKMVVAGATNTITLVRYDTTGKLDRSFADTGICKLPFPGSVKALYQQADGRLLVAGYNDTGFLLFRLHTNGTIDSSFGDHGTIITYPQGYLEARLYGIDVQPDGKILAVGYGKYGGGSTTGYFYDGLIVRYNANAATNTIVPKPTTSRVVISPNPARKTIHISNTTDNGLAQIQLYSVNGTEVYTKSAPGNEVDIIVAGFTPGMYIVKCRFNNGKVYSERILIQQ